MSDPYECVPTALKLKSSSSKNKKKKHKKKDRQEESHQETAEKNADQGSYSPERTKAELAFRKIQEKRQSEKIKKLASKTHKQRVEQLNAYLDSLTEHYDIPKIANDVMSSNHAKYLTFGQLGNGTESKWG
ncbi:uncharacterized protein TRIADDRAFT_51965 [Trichoplax adhaerens]|uniref:Protein FAM32A n=1 Tax=Trichoplax adhaerens TaxID=10228 RepID=B3RLD2_TRIAD|nr:hypothetical protein TRIADDRAFT_51965 [Trichoplax adhaerens]EDV28747.1 hypothetical protein TRIADDRAFT_51965 [Trichoplax adhaerens]|eukprot:XP_002107949.1 hypothetical protein TRIADDRAFT_51965 [Trichoplax adhaerens]